MGTRSMGIQKSLNGDAMHRYTKILEWGREVWVYKNPRMGTRSMGIQKSLNGDTKHGHTKILEWGRDA
jgi:hypothetical protein